MLITAEQCEFSGGILNAQELVTLAATRGIDLAHVAGNASDTHGIARRRTRTPTERRLGLHVVETAEGAETRSSRAPYYSHAEFGLAAAGLQRLPFLALQYSIAGHCDDFGELHRGLMVAELKLATRERWPWQVEKFDGSRSWYAQELAGLVLDADRHALIFRDSPGLYAVYLGVSEEIYRVKMEPLYRTLANEHGRWLATALAWVQRRITGPKYGEAIATAQASG